jgi:hypothetical protein
MPIFRRFLRKKEWFFRLDSNTEGLKIFIVSAFENTPKYASLHRDPLGCAFRAD